MTTLRPRLSRALVLAAVLATTSPTMAQTNGAAGTGGSVDPFNGAFTTEVPITVPEFRGITPTLRLTYNSANGNGWAGVGWSLAGTSYIYRRGPNEGMPTYTAADVFYLDGAELIPCTTQGGTHCTYIQNFARIKDEGGGIWTVRGTNGNLATYEPLITTTGGTYRWAITRLEDANGNQVFYDYWCDGGTYADDCYPNRSPTAAARRSCFTPSRDPIGFASAAGSRSESRAIA